MKTNRLTRLGDEVWKNGSSTGRLINQSNQVPFCYGEYTSSVDKLAIKLNKYVDTHSD